MSFQWNWTFQKYFLQSESSKFELTGDFHKNSKEIHAKGSNSREPRVKPLENQQAHDLTLDSAVTLSNNNQNNA